MTRVARRHGAERVEVDVEILRHVPRRWPPATGRGLAASGPPLREPPPAGRVARRRRAPSRRCRLPSANTIRPPPQRRRSPRQRSSVPARLRRRGAAGFSFAGVIGGDIPGVCRRSARPARPAGDVVIGRALGSERERCYFVLPHQGVPFGAPANIASKRYRKSAAATRISAAVGRLDRSRRLTDSAGLSRRDNHRGTFLCRS